MATIAAQQSSADADDDLLLFGCSDPTPPPQPASAVTAVCRSQGVLSLDATPATVAAVASPAADTPNSSNSQHILFPLAGDAYAAAPEKCEAAAVSGGAMGGSSSSHASGAVDGDAAADNGDTPNADDSDSDSDDDVPLGLFAAPLPPPPPQRVPSSSSASALMVPIVLGDDDNSSSRPLIMYGSPPPMASAEAGGGEGADGRRRRRLTTRDGDAARGEYSDAGKDGRMGTALRACSSEGGSAAGAASLRASCAVRLTEPLPPQFPRNDDTAAPVTATATATATTIPSQEEAPPVSIGDSQRTDSGTCKVTAVGDARCLPLLPLLHDANADDDDDAFFFPERGVANDDGHAAPKRDRACSNAMRADDEDNDNSAPQAPTTPLSSSLAATTPNVVGEEEATIRATKVFRAEAEEAAAAGATNSMAFVPTSASASHSLLRAQFFTPCNSVALPPMAVPLPAGGGGGGEAEAIFRRALGGAASDASQQQQQSNATTANTATPRTPQPKPKRTAVVGSGGAWPTATSRTPQATPKAGVKKKGSTATPTPTPQKGQQNGSLVAMFAKKAAANEAAKAAAAEALAAQEAADEAEAAAVRASVAVSVTTSIHSVANTPMKNNTNGPSASITSGPLASSSSTNVVTTMFPPLLANGPKLQTTLDFGQRSVGATVHCPRCGMLYNRCEEDMALHKKYCAKVSRSERGMGVGIGGSGASPSGGGRGAAAAEFNDLLSFDRKGFIAALKAIGAGLAQQQQQQREGGHFSSSVGSNYSSGGAPIAPVGRSIIERKEYEVYLLPNVRTLVELTEGGAAAGSSSASAVPLINWLQSGGPFQIVNGLYPDAELAVAVTYVGGSSSSGSAAASGAAARKKTVNTCEALELSFGTTSSATAAASKGRAGRGSAKVSAPSVASTGAGTKGLGSFFAPSSSSTSSALPSGRVEVAFVAAYYRNERSHEPMLAIDAAEPCPQRAHFLAMAGRGECENPLFEYRAAVAAYQRHIRIVERTSKIDVAFCYLSRKAAADNARRLPENFFSQVVRPTPERERRDRAGHALLSFALRCVREGAVYGYHLPEAALAFSSLLPSLALVYHSTDMANALAAYYAEREAAALAAAEAEMAERIARRKSEEAAAEAARRREAAEEATERLQNDGAAVSGESKEGAGAGASEIALPPPHEGDTDKADDASAPKTDVVVDDPPPPPLNYYQTSRYLRLAPLLYTPEGEAAPFDRLKVKELSA